MKKVNCFSFKREKNGLNNSFKLLFYHKQNFSNNIHSVYCRCKVLQENWKSVQKHLNIQKKQFFKIKNCTPVNNMATLNQTRFKHLCKIQQFQRTFSLISTVPYFKQNLRSKFSKTTPHKFKSMNIFMQQTMFYHNTILLFISVGY